MKTAQNMAILLWLRVSRKKDEKEAYIMVRVTINGKRSEWSLGKEVNPAHWVSGAGMLKSAAKESNQVNNYLNQVRGQIQQHYNILLAQNKPTNPEAIKNAFLGIEEETKKRKTILEAFEYHNAKFKERASVGKVSIKSWERLEITKNKVKSFMVDVLKCKDKPLDELRLSFATEFEHYLSVNKKMQSNTSMKYLKILKQIMNYAVGLDWIISNPFKQFKCTYSSPDREVLTQAEITTLLQKQMPNMRLEQVRDVFVFACYTGYAFSDIAKLTKDDIVRGIDGEKWIQTSRTKTNVQENVMLLNTALQILEKYKEHDLCKVKNKLLPVISNQRYNAYLKEIAAICDIKKHLTSHIARHTFATTVTLANGISLESVSAMLGHKNIRTTQIYAKVVQSKLSLEMKQLKSKLYPVQVNQVQNG